MIYVASDIHGNMAAFRSLMGKINLQSEDTLYVLGDVIDRHPGGLAILNVLMSMPNAKMLLGNHEQMALDSLDPPAFTEKAELDIDRLIENVELWYQNGGAVTHWGLKNMPKDARKALFAYLRSLPYSYTVEVNGQIYKLVHAAPEELYQYHREKYETIQKFMSWYRVQNDEPISNDDTIVIFGHTPTCLLGQMTDPLTIYYGDHRIGIDCGASFPEDYKKYNLPRGRLAALRLDDMVEFYSD